MGTEQVSSDEEEDSIPDELAFNAMAHALHNEPDPSNAGPSTEQMHIPNEPAQPDPLTTNQTAQPGPGFQPPNAIDWTNVLNAAQGPVAPGLPTAPTGPVDSLGTADDFSNLGHIFKLSSVKPEYEMNTCPIPNAILQMAYSKLFVPLSVLTSMALDKIQFNDGLKFHKVVFAFLGCLDLPDGTLTYGDGILASLS